MSNLNENLHNGIKMDKEVSLNVEFCGFLCENPFLLAASPVARDGKMIARAFDFGWGGAITKSVSLDQNLPDRSLSPRFVSIQPGGSNLSVHSQMTGLGNIDFRIDKTVEETFESYRQVKKDYPNKFLAVSIKVNYDRDNWMHMTSLAAATGCDAIEICLSCPDEGVCGDSICSTSIAQNPDAVKEVMGWVKEATDLPIIVKLINDDGLPIIAKAAYDAGAAAVSVINSIKCIPGFNLDTLTPVPTIDNVSTSVGLSGAAIKPIAEYCVYNIKRNEHTKHIPVSGVGGITYAQDAIEFLLLGAATVQVATQIMYEGYRIVEDFIVGLETFMKQHGYKNIDDFMGIAINNYVDSTKGLSREQQMKSNIDEEKCIRCGKCYISCMDGGYQAINVDDNRLMQVDQDRCVGCGLCKIVCPVDGAIYFNTDDKIMEGLF